MPKEVEQWITVNGVHIPLFKGDSKEETVKRFLSKQNETKSGTKQSPVNTGNKQTDDQKNITKNEDEKDQQIARNQKEAQERKAEENRPIQEVHKAKIKELESDKYEGDNTYDLDTLKPVSFEDGYQVTFCQIGDNYTNDQYQAKVNECLKLSSNGKTYAGKFEGTPEISFHCANREQAIAYAKANNQISIWDWKAGNADWRYGEIKTGGTGRRK